MARQAHAGNARARQELLDLALRSGGVDGRRTTLWGSLGLSALRGETQKTRRVDVLASRLRDGERLVYPKKLDRRLSFAWCSACRQPKAGPVRDTRLVVKIPSRHKAEALPCMRRKGL